MVLAVLGLIVVIAVGLIALAISKSRKGKSAETVKLVSKPAKEAPPETRTGFCPHCGAKVPDGARFCKNCGASIDT